MELQHRDHQLRYSKPMRWQHTTAHREEALQISWRALSQRAKKDPRYLLLRLRIEEGKKRSEKIFEPPETISLFDEVASALGLTNIFPRSTIKLLKLHPAILI